jgi:hypothetical protein
MGFFKEVELDVLELKGQGYNALEIHQVIPVLTIAEIQMIMDSDHDFDPPELYAELSADADAEFYGHS